MRNLKHIAVALIPALALYAADLRAADDLAANDPAAKDKWVTGRIGVGALVIPKYQGGSDYQVWPAPLIDVTFGDWGYIDYWQAGAYVFSSQDKKFGIAIVAAPRLGYDSGDGDRLTGMMTRKTGLDMGVSLDYGSEVGGVSLAYYYDVLNASKGGTGKLIGTRRFEITSALGVDAFAEAEWTSAKVTNYYFGVQQSEATAARPFYDPGSSVNFTGGLHFNFDFGSRSTILFGYEGTLLGNAAADSPIVERRFNSLFYVGYGLRL